jgi:hypothetical protein
MMKDTIEIESPAMKRYRATLMEGLDIVERFCELLRTGASYQSVLEDASTQENPQSPGPSPSSPSQ